MPTLTIDGIEVTVPDKTNLIEAAKMVGIEIPHYCYHPGLSVAGNCRMCLVEIEKAPKLAIGCFTPVTDGMVVHTSTEKVLQARKDVLEFLLINHPLDCPVCDQAGECWLQIYYMKHGQYASRMMEDKIKKHKKATPIGPTVTLDQERCILCARCVRFCDEIPKTSELGIFNRGNHAELDVFPGKELDNKYSGNVVDICPVGALTDRDFRFQCRVWYLDTQDSICPGCSRGCNMQIHYNLDRPHHAGGRRVLRLKPRLNPDVNKYWICDEGRYGYKFIDDASRIPMPQVKTESGMEFTSWDAALKTAAEKIKGVSPDEVAVIASPQLTNEELYLVRKLLVEELGIKRIDFRVPPKEDGYGDDYLINADKNPNTRGAAEIGLGLSDTEQILRDAAEKKIRTLVVLLHDLPGSGLDAALVQSALENVETLIFIGSNTNGTSDKADLILAASTYAEESGTFTNFEGRVQRIHEAVPPLVEALPEWQILNELARALGLEWDYQGTEHIFDELARKVPAFANLTYEVIGDRGQMLGYNTPDSAEEEVESADLKPVTTQ